VIGDMTTKYKFKIFRCHVGDMAVYDFADFDAQHAYDAFVTNTTLRQGAILRPYKEHNVLFSSRSLREV